MFKPRDLTVGIAAILLGAFILMASLPLNAQKALDPAGPAALPRVLAWAMIVIGAVHVAGGVYARRVLKEKLPSVSFSGWLQRYQNVIIIVAICLAYVYLLRILGYIILTPLLMLAILWVLKAREARRVLPLSLIMTVVLYGVFRFGLQVKLPMGFLQQLF